MYGLFEKEEYERIKRIRWGLERPAPVLIDLTNWIARRWKVEVVTVEYCPRKGNVAPRLSVILETEKEVTSFRVRGRRMANYDRKKQVAKHKAAGDEERYAREYFQLVKRQSDDLPETELLKACVGSPHHRMAQTCASG